MIDRTRIVHNSKCQSKAILCFQKQKKPVLKHKN